MLRWFYDISIFSKLLISFAVMLVLTLIVGITGGWGVVRILDRSDSMYNDRLMAAVQMFRISSDLMTMRSQLANHLQTTNVGVMKRYEDDIYVLDHNINQQLSNFAATYNVPAEVRGLETLRASLTTLRTLHDHELLLSRHNKKDSARKFHLEIMSDSIVAVISVVQQLVDIQDIEGKKLYEASAFTASSVKTILFSVVIGALIIGALLGVGVARILSRPVQRLEAAARRVARGDVEVNVLVESKDEIGGLSASFNVMVTNIRGMLEDVREKNERLTDANEEIHRQMGSMAEQSHGIEVANMKLQEKNEQIENALTQLASANGEIQRQLGVQEEQAREIELANVQLHEKNEEVEAALRKLKAAQTHLVQSEKMAGLGQLTAGIAHEINNPVNFISGAVKPLKRNLVYLLRVLNAYSNISIEADIKNDIERQLAEISALKDELSFDEIVVQTGNLAASIDEGARRIAEIVRVLQNFTRLDEDGLKFADVGEGLESTLTMLHREYEQHSTGAIRIVREFNEVPQIECYPGLVNQVFWHVLKNALQAIPDDIRGEVRISTRTVDDWVIISIRDNGVGVSDNTRTRVFEPFFTTKDVGEGRGLGLTIAYDIIEKHHGTIELQSKTGSGTEVIIALPVLQPSPETA